MKMVDRAVGMTCPSYLRHQRHDIVQDARLRLLKVADLEDPRFEVRSYLWKAAHSAVLDAMRAARRRARETLEEPTQLDGITTSDRPDPDRLARSKEVASAIRDCLSDLIDSRRRIVTLNLLGFGLSEIASMLGEERKRVDNLLYRGLVNLRECLLGKGVRP
jgi:RNA polymerase sigma-70 factor (ECF subfamily)